MHDSLDKVYFSSWIIQTFCGFPSELDKPTGLHDVTLLWFRLTVDSIRGRPIRISDVVSQTVIFLVLGTAHCQIHHLSFLSTRIFQHLSQSLCCSFPQLLTTWVSIHSCSFPQPLPVMHDIGWWWLLCGCCRLLLLADGQSHSKNSLLFLAWTTEKPFPHPESLFHQTQQWWARRWSRYWKCFSWKESWSACVGWRSGSGCWAHNLWAETVRPLDQSSHRRWDRCKGYLVLSPVRHEQ